MPKLLLSVDEKGFYHLLDQRGEVEIAVFQRAYFAALFGDVFFPGQGGYPVTITLQDGWKEPSDED